MKNKKILITILISILVLILAVIGIMLFSNTEEKIEFNENNFSVQIMEYNLFSNTENDADLFLVEVDNNNYHIVDEEDEYYFVDNEIIESLERTRDGKIIWINEKDKSNNIISDINGFTHEEFVKNSKIFSIDIVKQLMSADYKKEGGVYKVKLTTSLSNNIKKAIKDNYVYTNLNFEKNEDSAFSGCEGCFEIDEIKNIEFETNESNIEKIKIIFTNVVYDEQGNIDEDWSYDDFFETAIVFKFSNYGTTHVEISKDIKQSLEDTKAKDFVGTYVYNKTCSNGKKYDELIDLTDQFDYIFGIGWAVNYKVFDCESGYYTQSSAKYDIEDNIVTFYSGFGDVSAKFKYENNQLSELDDNNNVVAIFSKQ